MSRLRSQTRFFRLVLYFAPLPNMVQVEERPDSLPNEAIGTGPYQLVEWVRGDHISLTAYPE